MMHASSHGQVEVVDTLLQHGARVDLKENVRGYILSLTLHACWIHFMNYIRHSFP